MEGQSPSVNWRMHGPRYRVGESLSRLIDPRLPLAHCTSSAEIQQKVLENIAARVGTVNSAIGLVVQAELAAAL